MDFREIGRVVEGPCEHDNVFRRIFDKLNDCHRFEKFLPHEGIYKGV